MTDTIQEALKSVGLKERKQEPHYQPKPPRRERRIPSMVEATAITAREAVRRKHDSKEKGPHKPRSLAIIANMLGAEGFDEHAMRCIEYYTLRRSGLTDNQRMKYEDLRKAFSTIMKNLSAGDRMVVGKFIHWQCRMSHDAALKLGLAAHATRAQAARLGISIEGDAE